MTNGDSGLFNHASRNADGSTCVPLWCIMMLQEVPEKNGDSSGHRNQDVASLQLLTKRVTTRFNV